MEKALKNQEIIKFLTMEQLKTFIEQQEMIFDEVRLVDIATTKTYYLDDQQQICVKPHGCNEGWI